MILAFDEGAWHPDGSGLLLVLASFAIALIFQFRFAKGRRGGPGVYVASALPFIAVYAFIAYFDYGNSGYYTGSGSGARHLDLIASFWEALEYGIVFAPILLLLALGHWSWLRFKVPLLFWPVFALVALIQVFFALFFVLNWIELTR